MFTRAELNKNNFLTTYQVKVIEEKATKRSGDHPWVHGSKKERLGYLKLKQILRGGGGVVDASVSAGTLANSRETENWIQPRLRTKLSPLR